MPLNATTTLIGRPEPVGVPWHTQRPSMGGKIPPLWFILEVTAGVEPASNGFANRCLRRSAT